MNNQFSASQQAQIAYLTALGFPVDASIDALFRTHGDVDTARQLLAAMFQPVNTMYTHQHQHQQQQHQQQHQQQQWRGGSHGVYQSGAAIMPQVREKNDFFSRFSPDFFN
jgi:hypothetical protein